MLRQLEFTTPEKPSLAPIMELHRRHNGYVSFHRKHPESGEHEDLFSIKAADLDGFFPQLIPAFEKDSFFSIHGFYRAGYGYARNAPSGLNLERAHRKVSDLRWLTCTFADLDCHNLGIDAGQAVGAIISAQDAGHVPPASMLTRSGRGIWAFWFLRDAQDPSTPARAWDDKVLRWCSIQREIGSRLASVGADAAARDAARITRIAGSINTKSAARVGYWIQASGSGKPFVYTLDDLADFFGLSETPRHPRVQSQVDRLSERGRSGQRGRWLKARKNFERLWELRGTFKMGTRNNAVFVYAAILRSQRLDESAVWCELNRLFRDLEQDKHPFTLADLKDSAKVGVIKLGGIRNQTIANMLSVTPDEATMLDGWTAAEKYGQPLSEDETLNRPEKVLRRRGLIQARIDELGAVPTERELAEYITSQGIYCVPGTIHVDLKALNISNPRRRGRRGRKRARKNQRKLF